MDTVTGFLFLISVVRFALAVTDVNTTSSALEYLQQYALLPAPNPEFGTTISEKDMRNAVKRFQTMAGIEATGEINSETIDAMNLPRCGCSDTPTSSLSDKRRRRKRYTKHGSKWEKTDLTYRIKRYTKDLSEKDIDDTIRKALDVWSAVTPLTFTEKTSGKADIMIIFAKNDHGDNYPFDGPGHVLAHAFYPKYGGDAHFDDAEVWTLNQEKGTNLLQVAVHEFGHSLGLAHSAVSGALMGPFYRGYSETVKLHADDIAGIQAIYGSKPGLKALGSSDTTSSAPESKTQAPSTKPTPASATKPTVKPTDAATTNRPTTLNPEDAKQRWCEDPNFTPDTLITTADRRTYAFKGSEFAWLNNGIVKGYPKLIASTWKHLPDNLDASVTIMESEFTYFFKGDKYWVFWRWNYLDGPNTINVTFRGLPNDLTCAFEDPNGTLYFCKGQTFYKMTTCKTSVQGTVPRSSIWPDMPDTVSEIITWRNKRTYFFTEDGEYYRLNKKGDAADKGYPRETKDNWLGCSNAGQLKLRLRRSMETSRKPTQDKLQYGQDAIDEINPLEGDTVER